MLNTRESKLRNIGLQFFAEPAHADPVDPEPADPEPTDPRPGENPADPTTDDETAAELKRLKAELAKQKNALDSATKEAANYKKQLRAKLSTEEQEAEAAKERQDAMEAELAELRKQSAIGAISKKVMTFIGDEKTADDVAESLYGAEDVDAAIDEFNKAWAAKEKALRLEFSKIPYPASGGDEDKSQKDVEEGRKFGKTRMAAMQSPRDGLARFKK